MNYLALVLILVLEVNSAVAQNSREIDKFCKNQINYIKCENAYKGLPIINSPPDLPSVGPIKIKVIPFTRKAKTKNSHIKRIKRTENWNYIKEDLYD